MAEKPAPKPDPPLRHGETTTKRGKARLGSPFRPIPHTGTGG